MSNGILKTLRVNLDEEQGKMFDSVKSKLGLSQDSEVVRHLIKHFYDEQKAEASQ
jgi:metal-responsive CopG/Arc/MetJ family transcriptional regulator